MKTIELLGAAVLLSLGACGGGGGVAPKTTGPSCSGTNSGVEFCADLVSGPAGETTAFQTQCTTTLNGTFSSSACSRADAVGGCEDSGNGVEVITWFYGSSGATADEVESSCETDGQTFVSP